MSTVTVTQTRTVTLDRGQIELLVDAANGEPIYESDGGGLPRGFSSLLDLGLFRKGRDPRGTSRRFYFLTEAGSEVVRAHCRRVERWEVKP